MTTRNNVTSHINASDGDTIHFGFDLGSEYIDLGCLMTMPQTSGNNEYASGLILESLKNIYGLTSGATSIAFSWIPDGGDPGDALNRIAKVTPELIKDYAKMFGISALDNGLATRKYFKSSFHQRVSIQTRLDRSQFKSLWINDKGNPTSLHKVLGVHSSGDAIGQFSKAIGDLINPASFIDNDPTKKGSQTYIGDVLEILDTSVDKATLNGIQTPTNPQQGVSLAGIAKQLDKPNSRLKNVDVTSVLPPKDSKGDEKIKLSNLSDAVDIISAKTGNIVKSATASILTTASEVGFGVTDVVSKVLGNVGNYILTNAPLQVEYDSIVFTTSESGRRVELIPLQRPTKNGTIYDSQKYTIDTFNISPSKHLTGEIVNNQSILVPLYYDLTIEMTTTLLATQGCSNDFNFNFRDKKK